MCACASPFLVYSFVPTYDLFYVLPRVFRRPDFLNTRSALESAISCLIIVVLCRALPVPAGTRNKFPSTRLHAELPFPATALLCHRLPGEYMASTISLFSAHGLLILTVHLFLGAFFKKYRYFSLCTCMETLMDLYEWRQRKKEPTRR